MPDNISLTDLPDPGDRYVLGNFLGIGVCGEVFEATDSKSSGKKVAIKVQKLSAENEHNIQEEYRILKNFSNHPNLPDFYGAYRKTNDEGDIEIWFVMELCEGGPVTDLVRGLKLNNRRMAEEHIAYILKEAIKALNHLHDHRIIHRDVCGSNILLTKDGEVKLVDFGLSRELSSTLGKRGSCVGSVCWMAPEVVASAQSYNENNYGNRADVWAIGITAIELGDGQPPFQDMHPTRAMFQIVRNPPPTLQRISNWSNDFNDFIAECLEKNQEYRPYMAEIIDHPFLMKVPENSHYLTQELKKMNEDFGHMGIGLRHPESTVHKNMLKKTLDSPLEKMYLEDLAALENLSEEAILTELQERMVHGNFQTFVGDMLLILNPNEEQDIYTCVEHARYHLKSSSENPPHVFSIADRAYQDAIHHDSPQHILLAGESGSGKTTAHRHLVDHLVYMGTSRNGNGENIKRGLQIVEAFTHAATPTNPDSTRCILKTEVAFGATGKVSGATYSVHELEKWRVSSTDAAHSNFHILYYFYDAMEISGQLNIYLLDSGRSYRYLRIDPDSKTKEVRNNPKENAKKFDELREKMKFFSIEDETLQLICKILSAILNLGEIRFKDKSATAMIENMECCNKVAELLNLEEKKLAWALTNYCLIQKGTATRMKNTANQARDARDMLANCLYARLVDWVTHLIATRMNEIKALFGHKYSVSILDYFGFECFQRNDLEQLLVNTMNEQMQYHFIQRVFAWESLELLEEEIEPLALHYYNNKEAVQSLLGKPHGVLLLIDEASKTGHTNQYLMNMIQESCQGHYVKVNGGKDFSVAHYTGKVTYDIREMTYKNKNFLAPEMIETLRMSQDNTIREFFSKKLSKTGNLIYWDSKGVSWSKEHDNKGAVQEHQFSQTRQMRTTVSTFRAVSLEILRELSVGPGAGGTHFIRCVRSDLKPNRRGFHKELIRHQLRALSILDTARARQNGYPHRIPFAEFLKRYQFLAFDFDETVDMTLDNCRLLLIRLKMEGWIIGKTKIFLKYYNEEYLSGLYETQVRKIVKIQSMMRAFIARRNVKTKVDMIKRKQDARLIRQHTRDLEVEAAAALMIQKAYRGYNVRKKYEPLLKESGQIDKETADFLRPYFKKWKNKSLFQVLLQYRALRFQDLVNFSQQIHIYNQKVVHELEQNNSEIELETVDPHATVDAWLGNKKPSVWKIPFRFDDLPYYDTNHMCNLGTSGNTDEEHEWDAPLEWRQSIITETRQNDYEKCVNLSLVTPKQKASDKFLIDMPYTRDPSSPLKQLPALESPKPPSSHSSSKKSTPENLISSVNLRNIGMQSPNIYGSPNKYGSPSPSPMKIQSPSYLEKNECAKLANQDFEFIRSPVKSVTPSKSKRGPGNPIAELESIGRKRVDKTTDDDPPFNFQGMLRKTNYTRDSLKRSPSPTGAPHYNVLKNKMRSEDSIDEALERCWSTDGETDDIVRSEICPGMILEGKVSDL